MLVRAWWPVLLTAVLAVAYALVGEAEPDSGLTAVVVLLLSAAFHGVRPRPLRGSPAQNLAQVVLVPLGVAGCLWLLHMGFLFAVFSGPCDTDCTTRPWDPIGPVAGVGLALAALALAAATWWTWRRIERAKSSSARRTPRLLTTAPAVPVLVVTLAMGLAEGAAS